jgi:hypothetical protein
MTTNGGRIPVLKFDALERDEGAPCAGVARGVFLVDGCRVPHPSVSKGGRTISREVASEHLEAAVARDQTRLPMIR